MTLLDGPLLGVGDRLKIFVGVCTVIVIISPIYFLFLLAFSFSCVGRGMTICYEPKFVSLSFFFFSTDSVRTAAASIKFDIDVHTQQMSFFTARGLVELFFVICLWQNMTKRTQGTYLTKNILTSNAVTEHLLLYLPMERKQVWMSDLHVSVPRIRK